MESPYAGRAIIQDNFTDIVITIPSKKNWAIIAFMGFWLCGWFIGESTTTWSLFKGTAGAFDIFWLCGWTLGGVVVISIIVWNFIGKEIVTIAPGVVTLQRKGTIFFKTKSYDLNEAKHFRAEQTDPDYNNYRNRSFNNAFNPNNGTIKFEYGMQTIRFGDNLDEAEANYILDILRNKKLIK